MPESSTARDLDSAVQRGNSPRNEDLICGDGLNPGTSRVHLGERVSAGKAAFGECGDTAFTEAKGHMPVHAGRDSGPDDYPEWRVSPLPIQ